MICQLSCHNQLRHQCVLETKRQPESCHLTQLFDIDFDLSAAESEVIQDLAACSDHRPLPARPPREIGEIPRASIRFTLARRPWDDRRYPIPPALRRYALR